MLKTTEQYQSKLMTKSVTEAKANENHVTKRLVVQDTFSDNDAMKHYPLTAWLDMETPTQATYSFTLLASNK
ncbi:hypothetical protein KIN20_014225 [Parelaphostrongylus tenuis]|uniref:Uncharacterized protein n=1 Tax=Parelaphostrongylus tenuis TaxID=148309 RepID=A0AAD5MDA6_PARTN|nr:hypothetical protein KIN20_014225 [Parelaphostrongylus tenuis]